MRRLLSGRVLLINTPEPKLRRGIYAYVGDADHDSALGAGLELDARDRVSYPDAAQASGGLIYAVYDRDRYGAGEINLTVLSQHEIAAGQRDLADPVPGR